MEKPAQAGGAPLRARLKLCEGDTRIHRMWRAIIIIEDVFFRPICHGKLNLNRFSLNELFSRSSLSLRIIPRNLVGYWIFLLNFCFNLIPYELKLFRFKMDSSILNSTPLIKIWKKNPMVGYFFFFNLLIFVYFK